VTVDRDAEPGTYRIPVDVAFEYTAEVRNAETGDPILVQRRQSDTKRLTVEIVEQARFRVVESETDAAVGESGTVRVTLENVGSDPADDATVTLAGSDPDLRLGDSDSANTFVGDWPAGERRTVTARVTVAGDAVVRNYSLDALVTYRDTAGDRRDAPGRCSTGRRSVLRSRVCREHAPCGRRGRGARHTAQRRRPPGRGGPGHPADAGIGARLPDDHVPGR
jgi:hypothetical protein